MPTIRKSKYLVNNQLQYFRKISLYLRYGYHFYLPRKIPKNKDLEEIDDKILECYEVTFCRTTRAKRKQQNLSNIIYLRFDLDLILLATNTNHSEVKKRNFLPIKTYPYHFRSYSISLLSERPSIRLEQIRFNQIKKQLLKVSLHNKEKVTRFLRGISPYFFTGISNQRWQLLKLVNKKRKTAGLSKIDWNDVKIRKG